MKTNVERIGELVARRVERKWPKLGIGERVREPYGEIGAIDAIYADFESALDKFAVDDDWYEKQRRRPKTPKDGFWYAVILPDGAVLAGEDDLQLVDAVVIS